MIFWDIFTTLMRLGIAAIIIWKLTRFPHRFILCERIGMGMVGGSSLLTISVIWQLERSPFDGWANSIFSAGVLTYFIGRMYRHFRHERNNRVMINRHGR
jgi:hypothetical protein